MGIKTSWKSSAEGIMTHWLEMSAESKRYSTIFRGDACLNLGDRLERLLAVAFCRDIWDLLTDERSRAAVLVAERYADGLASRDDLLASRERAWAAWIDNSAAVATNAAAAADAARVATNAAAADAARAAADAAAAAAAAAAATAARAAADATAARAAAAAAAATAATAARAAADARAAARIARRQYWILQDRLLVSVVGPGWVFDQLWRTDTAVALARGMYESRDFSPTPILADALQDAGCDEPVLLDSLRDPESRWCRGARIIDLLLGRR